MDPNRWLMGTALVLASAAIAADHLASLPEPRQAPAAAERPARGAPCGAAPCGAGAAGAETRDDGGELTGARSRDAEPDDDELIGVRPADID